MFFFLTTNIDQVSIFIGSGFEYPDSLNLKKQIQELWATKLCA